jgi:hypothetical protein
LLESKFSFKSCVFNNFESNLLSHLRDLQDLASFASIIAFSDSYRRPFKIYATCCSCSSNCLPALSKLLFFWGGCISFCCFYHVYLLFHFYFADLLFFWVTVSLFLLIWSDPVEETFVAGGHSSSTAPFQFLAVPLQLQLFHDDCCFYCLGLFTEPFCCLLLPCAALREANGLVYDYFGIMNETITYHFCVCVCLYCFSCLDFVVV